MDGLKRLATISHLQAESAAEDLEATADKQETQNPKLPDKKPVQRESQDSLEPAWLVQILPFMEESIMNTDSLVLKEIEPGDRLENFEIQDLMSAYNQAENVKSDVEKK